MGLQAMVGVLGRGTRSGNYPYACARVRAKKSKLLPRDTYAKLLQMAVPEITQVVAEGEYRREVDELAAKFRGLELTEAALNVNEERVYSEIAGFVEGEAGALTTAFLERFKIHDIKVILRGKHYGAKPEEIMRELLIEDRDEFQFYKRLLAPEVEGIDGVIQALDESGAPGKPYARALKRVKETVDSPGTQDYEDGLDLAYYGTLLATIRPTSQATKLFLTFVKREIDVKNLLSALRYRKAKSTWEELEKVFVEGGAQLEAGMLRRVLEGSPDEVDSDLKALAFYDDLAGLHDSLRGGPLNKVAVEAEKHLMRFAETFSRRNPLSILPIIDYILRKHVEVRNLRAVVRGKEAGLDPDRIRDVLVL